MCTYIEVSKSSALPSDIHAYTYTHMNTYMHMCIHKHIYLLKKISFGSRMIEKVSDIDIDRYRDRDR